jgi:hypothetical protein
MPVCRIDMRPPPAAMDRPSPSTAPSMTFWSLRAQSLENSP